MKRMLITAIVALTAIVQSAYAVPVTGEDIIPPNGTNMPFGDIPLDTPVTSDLLGSLGAIRNAADSFGIWKNGRQIALGYGAQSWAFPGAIQIGEGSNVSGPHTLKIYDYLLLDQFGLIPYERLPEADMIRLSEGIVSQWTNAVLVVSNRTLSVEVMDGGAMTSVWVSGEDAAGEISELRAQLVALSARLAALEAGGGAREWNQYAADGTDNPEPGYMTLLNRPATMFASGFSWETSGACSVLCQTGTVAFATGGDGGEFRIGPSSGDYFGYAMGGTVIVGAKCRSIDSSTAGRTNGVVSMVYDYHGGDYPTLWYSSDLMVDFAEQTGVVWVDNQDGTATVTAPATTPKGFWYATSAAQIDSVFKSTMPIRADGGVFGSTNSLPVKYDSTIEITSGGRTYRIPAEAVQ